MPESAGVDVQVVRWEPSPSGNGPREGSVDQMGPAATPRHASGQPGFFRRTITNGQDALASSSEAIAVQIDQVAERMMTALEQAESGRQADRARAQQPAPLWQVSEVEVTFGVQLTGEVSLAVFSGSSESSAEVTLTFTRTDRPCGA
jgi:hypothetical protein